MSAEAGQKLKRTNMPLTVISLDVVRRCDFEWHAENGQIIIDKCEGVTPEQGLAMFGDWMIEAMLEASKKEGETHG